MALVGSGHRFLLSQQAVHADSHFSSAGINGEVKAIVGCTVRGRASFRDGRELSM